MNVTVRPETEADHSQIAQVIRDARVRFITRLSFLRNVC